MVVRVQKAPHSKSRGNGKRNGRKTLCESVPYFDKNTKHCVETVRIRQADGKTHTDGKTDDNSDHETLGNVFDRKTERHETFPNGETDFDVRSKTLGVPNGFPDKTFVRKNRCDDKTFRQAERQK